MNEKDAPRCRILRRHRWDKIEDELGLSVECTRCGLSWFEPRLFPVSA